MADPVKVGRVSKLFGLAGEVLINLYDTFPEHINNEEPLFVSIDSLAVPLFLEKFERRGRAGALVRFADFDTPERVGQLLGLELYVRQTTGQAEDQQRDDDQIYMEDFVGFTALFEGYDHRGTVASYVEHEHNPLFSIDVDGAEVLIPAAEELIASFDLDRCTITFSPPQGLLELFLE